MSTIKQIIERVDSKLTNAYNDEIKLDWIAKLDGKIAMDVMLMNITEVAQFDYKFPVDLGREPLVKFPYDDIYDRWLTVQIAAQDEEWSRYANALEYYNAYYEEFVNWFLSTYRPGQGSMGDGSGISSTPSYYLTAYGLAVMQGFTGSLEDWLESLHGQKGDPGDKGDPGAKLRIGKVESVDGPEDAYATISGTAADPVLDLGIPRQTGEFLKLVGGRMQGGIHMAGFPLKGLALPTADEDGASKAYVDSTGLCYRGLTSMIDPEDTSLRQGVYRVDSEIWGVSSGALLNWQLIPGVMGMQLLVSEEADRIWMRTAFGGSFRKWRQLGFEYGEELPEKGQDGQLYLLKV